MSNSSPRSERHNAAQLRRIFNDGGFWERAQRGELVALVKKSTVARHAVTEPEGTLSQIIEYYDADGRRVALVHQYLRPDGTLGGSGRPDPKRVVVGDEEWFV